MVDAISKTAQVPDLQMQPVTAKAPAKAEAVGGFDSVMKSVAADTVNSLYKSEMTAIAGINGKATVQQVVDQVMAAERALQTTIAVRDKVVAAYQEISRMAI